MITPSGRQSGSNLCVAQAALRPVHLAGAGVAALLVASSYAFPAAPEVRGTWLTTTANTHIATPANTAQTMQQLRGLGLNSTYVEVWKNGFTEFPSQTMQNLIGVSMKINASPGVPVQNRDLLSETLIQSHRNGMANVAWFEYGFAAKFGNPGTSSTELAKYMADRGWLLRDSAGAYTNSSNGFTWMNPLVPEVRNLLKGIVVEAVRKYDLDGIQFDDRLAWPVQFGYDDYTRNAYLQETGRNLPASYNDSHFKAWRAGKVTAFGQELIAAVKAERPGVLVSVSPAVAGWAYDNYLADWPAWRAAGMFDEIIPQVYRGNFNDFNRDWDGTGTITTGGQVQHMGDRRHDFAAGISINTGSGVITWNDAQQMVNLVRSTNPPVAGHVWWYSNGVLNTYASQMAAYYDVAGLGHAPRPDLPADWRPMPTVAAHSQANPSVWNVEVPVDGRYRVIRRIGDTWTEMTSTVFAAGSLALVYSSADAVELLVDRRPYLPADANLDGLVNLGDFSTLAANFNQPGKRWADGDFDLDHAVTIADFSLLAANFNRSIYDPGAMGRPAGAVPEPALLPAAAAIAAGALARRRSR